MVLGFTSCAEITNTDWNIVNSSLHVDINSVLASISSDDIHDSAIVKIGRDNSPWLLTSICTLFAVSTVECNASSFSSLTVIDGGWVGEILNWSMSVHVDSDIN